MTQKERDLLVTKINEATIRIDERTERLDKANIDHETRIRSIEKNVWIAAGAIMVLSIVINIIF